MSTDTHSAPVSAGIQTLVDTLKNEGVEAGRLQAEKILASAENKAAEIEKNARAKAEKIIADARKEAEFISSAGRQAFEMAGRDAVLDLKSFLEGRFARKLTHGVEKQMDDPGFLEKMILAVAGRSAVAPGPDLEIGVPAVLADDAGQAAFISELTREALGDGVSLVLDKAPDSGLTFRLKNQDVEVILTKASVAQMLLSHLQPRFRAMLDGKGL